MVARWSLLPVLAFLLFATCAGAETLTGPVAAVTDGDSIKVEVAETIHRIRLQGIDAPERGQAFGNERVISAIAQPPTGTA